MDGKRRLLSFVFVAHALVHGIVMSLPLFVPIWLTEFSVTRSAVGFAMALLFVCYGGMAIPAGILSDRFGADRFISLFLLLTGVGAIALSLVGRFGLLAAGLVAVGVGAGLYHAPALSLLSRQSYSSSRVFAVHNVGGHVGIGVAPLLTAVALSFHPWETVLKWGAVPFIVVGALFLVAGPRDTAARDRESTETIRAGIGALLVAGFLLVLALYFLRGVFLRGTMTFLPDFLELQSGLDAITILDRQIPPGRWIYSAILLIGTLGELLGGRLGERADPEVGLAALSLLAAVGLAGLAVTTGWPLFAVATLLGIVFFTFPPILQTLVARYSPAESRGLGYGVVSAGNLAAGGFVGTSLAGWLATVGTYGETFLVLAVVPVIAFVVVVVFLRHARSGQTPRPG